MQTQHLIESYNTHNAAKGEKHASVLHSKSWHFHCNTLSRIQIALIRCLSEKFLLCSVQLHSSFVCKRQRDACTHVDKKHDQLNACTVQSCVLCLQNITLSIPTESVCNEYSQTLPSFMSSSISELSCTHVTKQENMITHTSIVLDEGGT